MQTDKDAIREILLVAKRLDEKQLLNAVEGNISIKRGGLIYVTPSARNKAFLTEEMIAVTDLDGNQVGGTLKATSAHTAHTYALANINIPHTHKHTYTHKKTHIYTLHTHANTHCTRTH